MDPPLSDKKHDSDDTDDNLVQETKDVREDNNLVSNNTVTNTLNLEHGLFNAEQFFEEKEHVCKKCSKSFPLKAKLTLHIRKDHSFLAERGISSSSVETSGERTSPESRSQDPP